MVGFGIIKTGYLKIASSDIGFKGGVVLRFLFISSYLSLVCYERADVESEHS